MAYNKAFVDSDVILDMLLKREPFFIHSRTIFANRIQNQVEL